MVEFKKLTEKEISAITGETGFQKAIVIKDYYITLILYLIKEVKGIYFKGGTALHKIFLDYARLSEDIDLTITRSVEEVRKDITKILKGSGFFKKIVKDKDVDGFVRLVVYYGGFSNEEGVVFIDINKRAKLIMKPETHKINHLYSDSIPEFSFNTVAKKELIAGKIMAAIGRNKPRDHYDIYEIIKAKLPIDIALVKKKSKISNQEFNIIRMFNKAKKLKKKWDQDMDSLVVDKVTFQEVMTTLARYFKLKDEKDSVKDKKGKTNDKDSIMDDFF